MILDSCSRTECKIPKVLRHKYGVELLLAFAGAWSVFTTVPLLSQSQQATSNSTIELLGTIQQLETLNTFDNPRSLNRENYPRVVRFDYSTVRPGADNTTTDQTSVVFRRFLSAAEIQEFYSAVSVPEKLKTLNDPEVDPFLEASSVSQGYEYDRHQFEKFAPKQLSDDFQNHCVPMKEWQTKSFPTCNTVHEIQYSEQLLYIAEGGWRYTFGLRDYEEIAVKLFTLSDGYDYDIRAYEIHRIDALVSERLTASPYSMDIYGFCGVTTMYEKGHSDLSQELRKLKDLKQVGNLMISKQQLIWAQQVARSMADLHSFDYKRGNNSTVAHRDIKTTNIMIAKNGMVKLNDFNDSILRYWNVTSNKKCPFYHRGFPVFWGVGFKPVEMANGEAMEESADVFGLGGILYNILTGKLPYYELHGKKDEMRAALEKGELPTIPSPFNSTDAAPEVKLLVKLIRKCMALDPSERPSSKYVFAELKRHIKLV